MGVRVAVRPAARVQPFGGYLGAVVRAAIDPPAVIAVPVEAPGAATSAVPGPGAADLEAYLGAGAADVIACAELTGVGAGSARPLRLIELRYRPQDPGRQVVLVGKGIAFDSGELSLKPNEGMKL